MTQPDPQEPDREHVEPVEVTPGQQIKDTGDELRSDETSDPDDSKGPNLLKKLRPSAE